MNLKKVRSDIEEQARIKLSIMSKEEIEVKAAWKRKKILNVFTTITVICAYLSVGSLFILPYMTDSIETFLALIIELPFFIGLMIVGIVGHNKYRKVSDEDIVLDAIKEEIFSYGKTNANNIFKNAMEIYCIDTMHQIDTEKPEIDKRIIDVLLENKSQTHKIIVPIIEFSKENGIHSLSICSLLKEAFEKSKAIDVGNLEACLINEKRWFENTRDFKAFTPLQKSDWVYFEEHDDLFNGILGDLKQYLSIWHFHTDHSAEEFNVLLSHYQIKKALIKVFVFWKQIESISKNKELFKILTNALLKYQNVDMASKKTYELFLEYYVLQAHQFSLSSYKDLMRIFFNQRYENSEFYKPEEIVLGFDISNFSYGEIIDRIISDKLYKSYDVNKLLVSLLYEKVNDFEKLLYFIDELYDIDTYSEKIKKAATKDDLLNGEYEIPSISIYDIDLMSGAQFEEFLRDYFTNNGYICTLTKASGDQGIDLIAKKNDSVLAIQAKCYSNAVGNHAIMEAVAGTRYYNANQTMVITNSNFTKPAIELAKVNNVILWDRKILIEKLKEKKV